MKKRFAAVLLIAVAAVSSLAAVDILNSGIITMQQMPIQD